MELAEWGIDITRLKAGYHTTRLPDPDIDWVGTPFYTGKTIRIFLSYPSEDGAIAANIKYGLECFGMEVFLAHEDISPSKEWQNEIERTLRSCDVFLPLLTENYEFSPWTDQEAGMAFALGKIIIPLKVKINPYGFIARYQALKIKPDFVEVSCHEIIKIMECEPELIESLKDCIIRSFVNSSSFVDANYKSKMLAKLGPFNKNQLNEIVRAYLYNTQVSGGYNARTYVKTLFDENRDTIIPQLRKKFVEIKKS